MRLLKLGIYHDTYLRNFYAARPELKTQSYAAQHRALLDDFFGSSDFWTSELNKLNYETADLIANAEFLQQTWARENDFRSVSKTWLFETAAAQIKKFRPAVLLVADYSTFTAEFLKTIRRECPSIKLVLGWCGAPYRDLSVMREWDVALSCVPEMVAEFRAQGIRSGHVNHAFAPRILTALNLNAPPDVDFGFIGSILPHNRFHGARESLLRALVEATDLQIWTDLQSQPSESRPHARLPRRIYEMLRRAPQKFTAKLSAASAPAMPVEKAIDERIARRAKSPVFGVEMFQKLRQTRVVFNNHIDISPESASNMRLFEATGVGACLLTDRKENLPELFAPGTEVVTYDSADECVEKVRYLLENEPARRAIAEAGQRRTLREHTFENRAARIDEIIRQSLSSTT